MVKKIMIVGRTMWTQSTSVTDGRTDRQTDRITITDTVQRIASHGKNVCRPNATECIIAVQGHFRGKPRSLILVPIESAYSISC